MVSTDCEHGIRRVAHRWFKVVCPTLHRLRPQQSLGAGPRQVKKATACMPRFHRQQRAVPWDTFASASDDDQVLVSDVRYTADVSDDEGSWNIRLPFLTMVPKAGLEPARLAPPPPQDGVSTNSTTSARYCDFGGSPDSVPTFASASPGSRGIGTGGTSPCVS